MVKRTLTLAAVLFLAVTMGCTTAQKWAAGGAAAGAAVGGIWAAHTMGALNAGEGAAVGAAAGGLAGALIGDYIEEQREGDISKEDLEALRAENQSLKNQLAAKEQELANANRKIQDLENELNNLRNQLKNARIPAFEISLAADVLFRSGSARLSDQGRAALNDAAGKITAQYKDKFIMIEGHTDAQPIKHSSWKSNWELGAARSLTVLHYLTDKGVDPAMLSAATFSKYQPVADNTSKEGMAKNRRAVIVVYTAWPRGPAK